MFFNDTDFKTVMRLIMKFFSFIEIYFTLNIYIDEDLLLHSILIFIFIFLDEFWTTRIPLFYDIYSFYLESRKFVGFFLSIQK